MQLENKKVFVTGGAKGIGKAIVKAFCKQTAQVTFCDIDEQAGTQLTEELKAYSCNFIHLDLSDAKMLSATFTNLLEAKDGFDIIVNNAGISFFKPILDCSIAEFDKVLDINLRPVFIIAKLYATYRAKQSDYTSGRIINIASTRYLMSEEGTEAYTASKGGIVSLTHALAVSLSKYKVTVNCISPGWINTDLNAPLSNTDHSQHLSGRVGIPEDIARTCLFLAQDGNDFINGQNIVVDGGMTKKMIYKE